ncbi:hypothetical protein [Azospira restricta]|uniref:Uncharacterized protein n=1 Tax=Azospira restricta TaxID=404405 RepID=A0A974PV83_9RHOO|nr:hypothetical protein [Azospira restricta]QRJ62162.1 hypothetical protein IWH25_10140 [Azospira restricta]
MDTLQKLFNRLVGVREARGGRHGMPVAAERPRLPAAVELPACWRRRAKRGRGVSTMIRA